MGTAGPLALIAVLYLSAASPILELPALCKCSSGMFKGTGHPAS